MEFGNAFREKIHGDLSVFLACDDNFGDRIEEMFLPDRKNWNDQLPETLIEDQADLMSLRPSPIEGAPQSFQEAYQTYTATEGLNSNPFGALSGFKMNLDMYGVAPTWVGYICSQKVERPLCEWLDPTSPSLKIATTAMVGGPFYSPLGIWSSPIARAHDQAIPRLSIPLHSLIAQTMTTIDPSIKYMVTRPQTPMINIFTKSGIPFTSTFGEELRDSQGPYVRREYTMAIPYSLVDPRTDTTYSMSKEHIFTMHPFLGGIYRQDMEFPFVTIDVQELCSVRWKIRNEETPRINVGG